MAISPETVRLEGLSGYEVVLRNHKGLYVVRKKSKLPEQNPRLLSQYKKHAFFAFKKDKRFSVPEIIGNGYDGNLFWYSYRFIEGVTLLHFIETEPLPRVRPILEKTVKILEAYAEDTKYFEPEAKVFFTALNEKILDSYQRVKNPNLPAELIKKFKVLAPRLNYQVAPTLCHGDFTLDNIIVDSHQNLWLIDFVEIFFPHWWFDISKFFQDVDGGWYELTRGVRLQYNKLMFARDYILSGVDELDKRYRSVHSFLVAMHLLRNIPFLKDSPRLSASNKKEIVVQKIFSLLES